MESTKALFEASDNCALKVDMQIDLCIALFEASDNCALKVAHAKYLCMFV